MNKHSRLYRRHLRKALRHDFLGQYHTYMAKLTYALDKIPEFEIAVEGIQKQVEDLVGVNTDQMPVGRPTETVIMTDAEDADGEDT